MYSIKDWNPMSAVKAMFAKQARALLQSSAVCLIVGLSVQLAEGNPPTDEDPTDEDAGSVVDSAAPSVEESADSERSPNGREMESAATDGVGPAPAQSNALEPTEDAATTAAQSNRDHLARRVNELWNAVIEGKWDQVYEFATPAYREVYDKRHFFRRYGSQVERTGVELKSIEFSDEAESQAKVGLDILYKSRFGGYDLDLRQYHQEVWQKVDGEWWRVEPK